MKYLIYIIFIIITYIAGYSSNNTSNVKVDAFKYGVSQNQIESWKWLSGKWYGSQPSYTTGRREWLVDRKIDGTYSIKFRIHQIIGDEYYEHMEFGEWGVVGPLYFTIYKGLIEEGEIKEVDAADPYNRDAYIILELTVDKFTYKNISTDNEFTVVKVDNDFQLGMELSKHNQSLKHGTPPVGGAP